MLMTIFSFLFAMNQVNDLKFTIHHVAAVDGKLNYELTIVNVGREQMTVIKPQSFDNVHSIIDIMLVHKEGKITFAYPVTTVVSGAQATTSGALNAENLEINSQNTLCLAPGERFVQKESLTINEFQAVEGKSGDLVPGNYKLVIALNYESLRFAEQNFCDAPMFTNNVMIQKDLRIKAKHIKSQGSPK